MSPRERPGHANSEDFREAVAQWRLNVRTEVKKASSLPSAMFDACDPMLETRLAESAEAMLACLQEPADHLRDPGDLADKRLEHVPPEDLRALPQRIGTIDDEALDLRTGLSTEYLGILIDTACVAVGPAQHGALQLLQRDFDVQPGNDAAALAELLARQVHDVVTEGPGRPAPDDEQLALTCQRLIAALSLPARGEGALP